MSWLSALGSIAGNVIPALFTGGASLAATLPATLAKSGMEIASSALGAKSQASASNRGTALEAQQDIGQLLMDRDKQYQDMAISREQEGRAGQNQAWKGLQSAQHLLSPAPQPVVSPYGAAPRQSTDAERAGADAMTQQLLARLQGGNPIAAQAPRQLLNDEAGFRIDPGLMKAGKGESITGWLAAGLPMAGQIFNGIQNKPKTTPAPPPNWFGGGGVF